MWIYKTWRSRREKLDGKKWERLKRKWQIESWRRCKREGRKGEQMGEKWLWRGKRWEIIEKEGRDGWARNGLWGRHSCRREEACVVQIWRKQLVCLNYSARPAKEKRGAWREKAERAKMRWERWQGVWGKWNTRQKTVDSRKERKAGGLTTKNSRNFIPIKLYKKGRVVDVSIILNWLEIEALKQW